MVTLIKNASLLKKNSIEQRSDGVWEMPGISGSCASSLPCIVCLYKKVTKLDTKRGLKFSIAGYSLQKQKLAFEILPLGGLS